MTILSTPNRKDKENAATKPFNFTGQDLPLASNCFDPLPVSRRWRSVLRTCRTLRRS
jgi:hypothetical protein